VQPSSPGRVVICPERCRQRAQVGQWIRAVLGEHLGAHVISAGIEVLDEARRYRVRVPMRHEGINEPVTACTVPKLACGR
jgi:hypothetical protein